MDKKEVEKIKVLISDLRQAIKDKDQEIKRLNEENLALTKTVETFGARCQELQNEYDRLKISKAAILLSKNDISSAKKMINRMIRDIDICIEQLQK